MTKTMTISSEIGSREVNKEQAKKVIATTAMSWCLTEEEVRNDVPLFKKMADFFELDLQDLVATPSTSSHDFPNYFQWVKRKRYIKKPIEVVAWQFMNDEFHVVPQWVKEYIKVGRVTIIEEPIDSESLMYIQNKHGGTLVMKEGDFLVDGGDGDIYPCEQFIFYKTYEEVK